MDYPKMRVTHRMEGSVIFADIPGMTWPMVAQTYDPLFVPGAWNAANLARLFAAAPEMLEALQELADAVREHGLMEHVLGEAKLAKADAALAAAKPQGGE